MIEQHRYSQRHYTRRLLYVKPPSPMIQAIKRVPVPRHFSYYQVIFKQRNTPSERAERSHPMQTALKNTIAPLHTPALHNQVVQNRAAATSAITATIHAAVFFQPAGGYLFCVDTLGAHVGTNRQHVDYASTLMVYSSIGMADSKSFVTILVAVMTRCVGEKRYSSRQQITAAAPVKSFSAEVGAVATEWVGVVIVTFVMGMSEMVPLQAGHFILAGSTSKRNST